MPTKLGQNFLKDQSVLEKIIANANLSANDLVLEVGPGEGVLTEKLLRHAKKVLAIEVDQNLIPKLQSRFLKNENLEIVHADILEINLPKLLEASFQEIDKNISYKVIANIPYYITSAIIRLFLETKYPPTEMLLMIQKEVAERIVAKPGAMSILALSVQYYATPELLFTVSKNSFNPVPEVDSAVIRIMLNKNDLTKKEEARAFFKLVKAGFSAKRKTLANNLSSSLHLEKNVVEEKLAQFGITKNQRAQELSLENWKKLVDIFEK